MQDQLTSNPAAARCARFADRFNLLGIDPAATGVQVAQAYSTACARGATPIPVLTEARDNLIDPARRLLCELTYPLDSSVDQLRAFYAGLSGNAPTSELLLTANALPPLSKVNFLACLAARQPADGNLLTALVEAHAAIEATTIFELLRQYRSHSGFPMPSLVDTGQGLQELLTIHSEAVLATFEKIQGAASPLCDCVRQIFSADNRHRIEALSGLLNAYRKSLSALNLSASHEIDLACEGVQRHPDHASAHKRFEEALVGQILSIAPLVLFDSHLKLHNAEAEKIVARTRALLADLIARGDHEAARKIVTVCLDAFSPLPGLVGPFEEAAVALRELKLEAEIRPLEALIQDFDRQPALLVASIRRKGFGKRSTGQARTLWQAFSAAVAATNQTDLHERPWMSIRDFALHLNTRPESAKAATRVISDLLQFGETLPANSVVLDILRQDLSRLEASNGPAAVKGSRTTWYLKAAFFITLVAVVMFAAFLIHGHLDLPSSPLVASTPSAVPKAEPEIIPPAGKGERFKLDFVRYCHFQEERLRVIKQHVQGTEDIQAFNMLANDYNSRCSNFYYLDEDLKTVMEEVRAKRQALEADAMRILSTWPWHAAGNPSPPAVK
jgi:hypothetical protein